MHTIKENDIRILKELRRDGRHSLKNISNELGIPLSTVHDRVRHIEKKFIHRYTALIDFSKVGFNLRVNMLVKLNDEDEMEEIISYLKENVFVNSVYRITEHYDLAIEIVLDSMRTLSEFKKEFSSKFSIADIMEYHLIDELKKEEFMATS